MNADEVRALCRPPLGRLLDVSPTFVLFRAELSIALGRIRSGVRAWGEEHGLLIYICDVESRRLDFVLWREAVRS